MQFVVWTFSKLKIPEILGIPDSMRVVIVRVDNEKIKTTAIAAISISIDAAYYENKIHHKF